MKKPTLQTNVFSCHFKQTYACFGRPKTIFLVSPSFYLYTQNQIYQLISYGNRADKRIPRFDYCDYLENVQQENKGAFF